jgi:hypothetical protein
MPTKTQIAYEKLIPIARQSPQTLATQKSSPLAKTYENQ